MTHKEKWYATMRAKLKTNDEGVRKYMAEQSKKGKKVGIAGLSEERKQEISKKGHIARWGA